MRNGAKLCDGWVGRQSAGRDHEVSEWVSMRAVQLHNCCSICANVQLYKCANAIFVQTCVELCKCASARRLCNCKTHFWPNHTLPIPIIYPEMLYMCLCVCVSHFCTKLLREWSQKAICPFSPGPKLWMVQNGTNKNTLEKYAKYCHHVGEGGQL